jgi:hypothetical protein
MGNDPSLSSLLDWLGSQSHNKMLSQVSIESMRHLCRLVDTKNSNISSCLLLEIHHANHGLIDLSLRGGHSLLSVPGISYPGFAFDLVDYLKRNYPTIDKNIGVEFDRVGNGYKLMGFFQKYTDECHNLACALDSIEHYAYLRKNELGTQYGGSITSTSKSLTAIQCLIEAIGAPLFIGFIDRGMSAVKLVINVTKSNLESVVDFCDHYFHHIITSQLHGSNFLRCMIQNLLATHMEPRFSVDINLASATYIDRFSFEFKLRREVSSESISSEFLTNNLGSNFSFEDFFCDYSKSLLLQKDLPIYSKRPLSTNSVESDFFAILHSHAKLSLSISCAEVKDYAWVIGKNLCPGSMQLPNLWFGA